METNLARFPKTLFVGQKEYFRQTYFDALHANHHMEFNILSGDLSAIRRIPDFITANKIRVMVIFRPEWFALFPTEFEIIRKMGVYTVGYSTEPIPLDGINPHENQLLRLKNLSDVQKVPYDLIIHYDSASKATIESLHIANHAFLPLPVSFKLFYPEKQVPSEFDLCFLGRATDYRESFLLRLQSVYNLIHGANGLNDEWARFFINRSRLVLNLHNLGYLNFESRVVQSLLCQKLTLSQKLSNNHLPEIKNCLEFFSTPEELFELASSHLQNKTVATEYPREILFNFHITRLFELITSHRNL